MRNITIILLLAFAVLASAAQTKTASVLLQEGLYAEEIEGDLNAAIEIYQRIVKKFPNNRPVAAKALLHIGQCYEKLGRQEAQKAYRRLIQEFADQPEPVQIAREHLEQLDGGAPGTAGNGPTYRLVLDDQMAGMPVGLLRDFSPSGDRIVFASEDKLYIADQTGTVIRPILDDFGPWESLRSTRWSPDGRLISYRATREAASDSGAGRVQAIFVISPEGGTPRQIGPQVRGTVHGPYWTPDGKHLTYITWGEGGGLHTFTLDGDEVRFIRVEDMVSEGTELHWGCSYSPDGRWLVYSRKKENARYRLDMDLYIIPATGGTPRRLTHLPEFNGHTAWAPDSRTVYFVSGPPHWLPGTRNIWKLAMDPETGSAKGEPQQVTFFKDVYIMWPQVLGDGDRIAFTMWKQNTSIRVADASSPQEARPLVRSGKYSPELSPDGQTVYYVNATSGEEGIYSVPRHGGASRRLTQSLPAEASHSHLPRFNLAPDGRTLVYVTKLGKEQGLYTLPVSGGEPKLLVKTTSVDLSMVPQWSPDGSNLAYADGEGLYVIPKTGGQPRELAHLDRGWEEWTVRWSPDGKFLAAFCADMDDTPTPGPQNAVFVVPASGGELRQLTPDVEYKEGLEWHPDGKRLTFHISRYNSETRQAYLDGRPPSLLFDAPDMWDYVGIWAPDGRRFFFTDVDNMYVYDEASGKTTPVTDSLASVGVPCFSRDGKTMAWWASRSTGQQTWIMENFQPESK